jgi:hypothetical protein
MRTAVWPRRAKRGRHHRAVLVTFRPTWRQTLSAGLRAGGAGAMSLALVATAATVAPPLAGQIAGTTRGIAHLPALAWFAVVLPLPLGVLGALLLGRQVGVRLDGVGVHPLSLARQSVAAWALVMDVRTERRRRRTVVVLYLRDGTIVRLRAPYDGGLLGRDPQFERKLFMIRHVWETHRQLRNRVGTR